MLVFGPSDNLLVVLVIKDLFCKRLLEIGCGLGAKYREVVHMSLGLDAVSIVFNAVECPHEDENRKNTGDERNGK
jgi:hypothetical protein